MSITYELLEKNNKLVDFYNLILRTAHLHCRFEEFDKAIKLYDKALLFLRKNEQNHSFTVRDSEYAAVVGDKAKAVLKKSELCHDYHEAIKLQLAAEALLKESYMLFQKTNDVVRKNLIEVLIIDLDLKKDGYLLKALNSYEKVITNISVLINTVSTEEKSFCLIEFANIMVHYCALYIEALDNSCDRSNLLKDIERPISYLSAASSIYRLETPNDTLIFLDIRKIYLAMLLAANYGDDELSYDEILSSYNNLLKEYKKQFEEDGVDKDNENLTDVYLCLSALYYKMGIKNLCKHNIDISIELSQAFNYSNQEKDLRRRYLGDKTKPARELLNKSVEQCYLALKTTNNKMTHVLGKVFLNIGSIKIALYAVTLNDKYLKEMVNELTEYLHLLKEKEETNIITAKLNDFIGRAFFYLKRRESLNYFEEAKRIFILNGLKKDSIEISRINYYMEFI